MRTPCHIHRVDGVRAAATARARPRRRDEFTSLIFGGTQVVEGMEVVKEIEAVPTDGRDKPVDAVRVETITIEE